MTNHEDPAVDMEGTPAKSSSDDGVAKDRSLGFHVVALGASAGGLAALREFFQSLPESTGMAFVVVQHLAPRQDSDLTAILQRSTSMDVHQLRQTTPLKPDNVYVIAPNSEISIKGGEIQLGEVSTDRRSHISIDHFFQSLAEDQGENAIGIVLSGTQHDGALGITTIKERGGITFAQSPDEAEYSSMPQSAAETGRVDFILPVSEIAARLAAFAAGSYDVNGGADGADHKTPESTYQAIIGQLHVITGHDFSHYKRSTLERRIHRRRQLLQLHDFEDYLDHLRGNKEEANALFGEILIGVTEFFRDPEAFEALDEKVIGPLYDHKERGVPLRIWVPACSTGEEVYSLAILLWEEAQRREVVADFKIFATDIDDRAIDAARRGLFSEAVCQGLSKQRRERYFEARGKNFRVVKFLRDRVLFAVHDMLKDPPFARQDLVSCRNFLIYLDDEAQRKVFQVVHYALRPGGYLFLGASEFIGGSKDLFRPMDSTHRIYRPEPLERPILPLSGLSEAGPRRDLAEAEHFKSHVDLPGDLKRTHDEVLVARYAPPSALIDRENTILHVSGDVAPYLRIPPGKPTSDILKAVQPELRMKLRTAVVNAFELPGNTATAPVTFERDGKTHRLRIFVQPIGDGPAKERALVTFEPVERPSAISAQDTVEIDDSDTSLHAVIERLEVELESSRLDLDRTIERYETTTEELRTSNEELLAINEELQSTSEELETSREELQSTNEELITVNEELNHKLIELDDVNSDLKNLLSATDIGTIFLDRKLHVRRFTHPVANYFNILETDIGRPIEHITHNLEHDGLLDDARQVLSDLQPIERIVSSKGGKTFIVRTLPYRTVDDRIDGVVLTFFDITDRQQAQERLAESELLFRTVFESASDALFIFHLDDEDSPSTFVEVNEGASIRLGYSHDDLLRMTIVDIVEPTSTDMTAYLQTLRQTGRAVAEVHFRTRSGGHHVEEISSRHFQVAGQSTVLSVSRDITQRKRYEEALLVAKDESERLAELRASFLTNMSHEIRTPLTSIIGVSQLLSQKDLSEQQQKMVNLIRTSGQRLHKTLDSVLDISRIEAGEMEPQFKEFDVAAQIEEDVDMLRPIASQKDLELHFHSPSPSLLFWTDPGFLNRIVYNLVENAIKFTKEGMVEVFVESKNGVLKLIVSDTGIGIDDDFLPYIFEKFKQASSGISRSFEGSGLGMALVKHLTELMGGNIAVDSKKGKGTTFTVILPQQSPHE